MEPEAPWYVHFVVAMMVVFSLVIFLELVRP